MPAWFQHLPSVGWEKGKSKNDLRTKRGRAKEWKRCILTAQHLNERVFLGMLAPARKHENEHRLWHLGITFLRMDNPQVRLPSRSGCKTFPLTLGACAGIRVRISANVCLRVHFVTRQYQHWTKWGPRVLPEMHNTEEASHIVGVMAVREVSLAYRCCGLCSWRSQLPHQKVRTPLKRNSLQSFA